MKGIARELVATAIPSFKVSLLSLLVSTVAFGWPGLSVLVPGAEASAAILAKVVFHAEPAVSGDMIRLGEIARVESKDPELRRRLEALEVGRAALPGQSRFVHVGTLRLRMRQARLPERQIAIEAESETIPVLTRYQKLDADRLKRVVEEWYAAATALPEGATLQLKVDVSEEIAPVGDVTIAVAMDSPRWGAAAVPLEIRVGDRTYKRINASVEALIEQPVWVTVRSFNRGEQVSAGDVQLLPRLLSQPVSGPEELTRPVRTTRFVREGTVLTWDLVEPVPEVLKGNGSWSSPPREASSSKFPVKR